MSNASHLPCVGMQLSRRAALLGLGCAVSLGRTSLALADAPTDRRFVVVLLRGGLDGLASVTPYGDPALRGLRASLLPPDPGQPGGLLDLGGFYGLHPSLTGVQGMFKANQALIVHAVAGPYRSRSHFEAQDLMESGADHALTSGWLNRAAAGLPARRRNPPIESAMSVGTTAPLLLRGQAPITGWAPATYRPLSERLYGEVAALHGSDPATARVFADAMRDRRFTQAVLPGGQHARADFSFPSLAAATGRLLATQDGPRIAALEVVGYWDTHMNQAHRLVGPLQQLDAGLVQLRDTLGPAWQQTVVLVITEFGRTAHVNGNAGTDHGTATAAFVVGGAVQGGRVIATWPGLGQGKLFENRDLAPTADIRSVAKGVLADHLGLPDTVLAATFPGSASAAAMRGLVRAAVA